jgi:hypothetical protein
VTAYDRPVYVNELEEGGYDAILFTGCRWIVTFYTSGWMSGSTETTVDIMDYLAHFDGHYSNFTAAFISGPVDVGRPSNAATPIQEDWFRTTEQSSGLDIQSADENFPIDVDFICATCNNGTATCSFNSVCNSDGTCECTTGARGVRCQIAPVANGQCNGFFNTQEFNFDGGDCCESTCVSCQNLLYKGVVRRRRRHGEMEMSP